jgi:hypothetical protein
VTITAPQPNQVFKVDQPIPLNASVDGGIKLSLYTGLDLKAGIAGLEIQEDPCKDARDNSSSRETSDSCTQHPQRRKQLPNDITLASEEEARREAFRRMNIPSENNDTFERITTYGGNPNLKGPKGEPYEIIKTLNSYGDIIDIEHHKWGHYFSDNNTYELPHYHANGHVSYPTNYGNHTIFPKN